MEVARLLSDRQVRRWWISGAVDADQYALRRRFDGRFVGCVWVSYPEPEAELADVSVAVVAGARGFGLGSEALDAVATGLLCGHGLRRVQLRIAAGHLAASRAADRAGFALEGMLRGAALVCGMRVDLQLWSLIAADLQPAGRLCRYPDDR